MNLESAKVQNTLIMELKKIFLEGAYQCQWLVFFVPSWHPSVKPLIVSPAGPLASFCETTYSASCPACSLCSRFFAC